MLFDRPETIGGLKFKHAAKTKVSNGKISKPQCTHFKIGSSVYSWTPWEDGLEFVTHIDPVTVLEFTNV